MKKLPLACLMVTLALDGAAHARQAARPPSTENTPDACRDGIDNDGDGYVDCADQDCQLFVFCQSGAQPQTVAPAPPQTIAPAPPPAVAPTPPAPAYAPYLPPVDRPKRGNPLSLVIAGGVLVVVGIALAAGSTPLWNDGLDTDHTALNKFRSTHDGIEIGGAAGLTVIGLAAFATGAALTAVGIVRYARARSAHASTWRPTVQLDSGRAVLGLGGSF